MIKEILTAWGRPHRSAGYANKRPPAGTYAVYMDDVSKSGADPVPSLAASGLPRVYTHNVTVELYAETKDDAARADLEAAIEAQGLDWEAQDWYWLREEQRYQAIYEITYTTKRR